MATHSSILAWRIPGTGVPGGLPFMGSHRVGQDWGDLAAVAAAHISMASPVAQQIKNLPAMQKTQEMRILSLDWEDPLEEEMATHSSTLKGRLLRIEDPGGLQSIGSQRIRRDWATKPTCTHKQGVENGSSRQYSCLETFIDRGVWRAKVRGAAKNWTWLNMHIQKHLSVYITSLIHNLQSVHHSSTLS